jgi:hypothetical protein
MKYAYGMRARGFSIGCQPKVDFIERIDDKSDTFYDILIYGRKLSDKEVSDYELVYLGKIDKKTLDNGEIV